jgi:hypothetical protein
LIPPSEGERLARAASGPTEFVLFEEGNHVCFNISYRFRPLMADWMAEALAVRGIEVACESGQGPAPADSRHSPF